MFADDTNSLWQMREFMVLTENVGHEFGLPALSEVEVIVEAEEVTTVDMSILSDLADLAERLRTYRDDGTGDYALGIEMGMERAAEMVDNVINRFSKEG